VDLLFGCSLHGTRYADIARAVVEVEFNPPGDGELGALEQDETDRSDRGSSRPNAKEDPR
jgi:hypothetical protein